MKHYSFKMRDEYGVESWGHVDAEDWKAAWAKLCILIRAGYKILVVNDLDDPEDKLETIDMPVPVKVDHPEETDESKLYKITFMLISGDEFNVLAYEGLKDHVNAWFHDPEVTTPTTIALSIEDTTFSLDRMFVGAVLCAEVTKEDEVESNIEEGDTVNDNV